MEPKNNYQSRKSITLLRVAALLFLGSLLALFALKYVALNQFLLHFNTSRHIVPEGIWEGMVKILSYSAQIMIDYFILWILTKSHTYSMVMVYVSLGLLTIGFILIYLALITRHSLPLALSGFFAKLVKTQILLVLFIATFIVESSYKTKINQ